MLGLQLRVLRLGLRDALELSGRYPRGRLDALGYLPDGPPLRDRQGVVDGLGTFLERGDGVDVVHACRQVVRAGLELAVALLEPRPDPEHERVGDRATLGEDGRDLRGRRLGGNDDLDGPARCQTTLVSEERVPHADADRCCEQHQAEPGGQSPTGAARLAPYLMTGATPFDRPRRARKALAPRPPQRPIVRIRHPASPSEPLPRRLSRNPCSISAAATMSTAAFESRALTPDALIVRAASLVERRSSHNSSGSRKR